MKKSQQRIRKSMNNFNMKENFEVLPNTVNIGGKNDTALELNPSRLIDQRQRYENVVNHVRRNRVPAKEGRRCVDGRYTSDEGTLARAGGDFGYVMALLRLNKEKGLGFTPEQCFDLIYQIVTETGDSFYMHTDNHAESINKQNGHMVTIGCGHIAKASSQEFSEFYKGLDPKDVQKALEYAKEKIKNEGKNIKMVTLEGEHKEQAVLVVLSEDETIKPYDTEKEDRMYFVYDRTRDIQFAGKLVDRLGISEISKEEFMKVLDEQTEATLKILAKGKQIFAVKINPKNVDVQPQGLVDA